MSTTSVKALGSRGVLLFSYGTPVAAIVGGIPYQTEEHWSVTTRGHINTWFREQNVERPVVKPQFWFNKLAAGEYGVEEEKKPFDPETMPQVFLGGITLLLQQPGTKYITRLVEDEQGFGEALNKEVPGFKSFDVGATYFNGSYSGEAPSITLINGIIPIVVEVPDNCPDLHVFVEQTSQKVLEIWERFAK